LAQRKPNIKSLSRRQDVSGLVAAASYRDVQPGPQGESTDLGIQIRAEAILALGRIEPASGESAAAIGLRDPADVVRCAAIRALHARREPEALVRALNWLPAGEGRSRKLALQAVFDLRERVSAPMLAEALIARQDEELLGDDEAALILKLVEHDRTGEKEELVWLLVHSLDSERGIVVDRAMDLLVRLAPASTDAVAAKLRAGPSSAEAACVLGMIGDPRTVDVLVEALGHGDGGVRAESAAALAELRDPSAVKPLLTATHDPDHSVRREAGVALERMGTAAVIAGVAELLEPMIHEAVRSALAHRDHDAEASPPPPRSTGRQSRSSHRRAGSNGKAAGSNGKAAGSNGKPRSTPKSGESSRKPAASNGKPRSTARSAESSRKTVASNGKPRATAEGDESTAKAPEGTEQEAPSDAKAPESGANAAEAHEPPAKPDSPGSGSSPTR
jgi:HEAT repeat protein